jgi:cobyrinic acid a,c-diamide synthase
MSELPRLAVGSVTPETDCRPVVWAILDVLDRYGLRIQSFLPRSCLAEVEAASVITGIAPRHLDSWLMTRDFCRQTFLRVARQCDLAIVEGDLSAASAGQPGGQLQTLCDWLALPRLGVWNVRGMADHHLSTRRPTADALIIDGVADASEFYRLQTMIESLWGLPVLGAIEEWSGLREAVGQLSPGERPSRDLCACLGDNLLQYVRPAALAELAQRRKLPSFDCDEEFIPQASQLPAGEPIEPSERLRRAIRDRVHPGQRDLTVAVAYDEVFRGYFPDTLDALEQLGATVRDFSPLRDEALPPDCDLVYIGCGKPQLWADELSRNSCLHAALRDHVCAGRRIYAEGGGMAFLCQHVVLPDGPSDSRRVAMAGVLPAVAHLSALRHPPRPIEMTLSGSRWLGQRGQQLRGYLNENWRIEPTGLASCCAIEPEHQCDLVERHQAVGSRVHFDLAAQPALLQAFLEPCPPALDWAAAR